MKIKLVETSNCRKCGKKIIWNPLGGWIHMFPDKYTKHQAVPSGMRDGQLKRG